MATTFGEGSDAGDNVVFRVSADGELDESFGDGGGVRTGIRGSRGGSISVDGFGGVVVTAVSDELVRLRSGGTPDENFSGDGVVEAPEGSKASATAFRPDGSLLVGLSPGSVMALRPDGTPDPSFEQEGVVPLGFSSDRVSDIAVAPDGTAYVQASDCNTALDGGYGCQGSLLRVSPAGVLDTSFSQATGDFDQDPVDVNDSGVRAGLAIAADGTLIVAKVPRANESGRLAVTRFLPTGEVDTSYGRAGTAGAYPGGCFSFQDDLAIDAEGRVVIGARACGPLRQVLVRLSATPGPPDADGDGVRDRPDRCELFPGGRKDGCAKARRKVRVTGLDKSGASGELRGIAACERRTEVRLLRRHPGRDKVVARTSTRAGEWSIEKSLAPGTYYALAPGSVGVERAFCTADASGLRRVRG